MNLWFRHDCSSAGFPLISGGGDNSETSKIIHFCAKIAVVSPLQRFSGNRRSTHHHVCIYYGDMIFSKWLTEPTDTDDDVFCYVLDNPSIVSRYDLKIGVDDHWRRCPLLTKTVYFTFDERYSFNRSWEKLEIY